MRSWFLFENFVLWEGRGCLSLLFSFSEQVCEGIGMDTHLISWILFRSFGQLAVVWDVGLHYFWRTKSPPLTRLIHITSHQSEWSRETSIHTQTHHQNTHKGKRNTQFTSRNPIGVCYNTREIKASQAWEPNEYEYGHLKAKYCSSNWVNQLTCDMCQAIT